MNMGAARKYFLAGLELRGVDVLPEEAKHWFDVGYIGRLADFAGVTPAHAVRQWITEETIDNVLNKNFGRPRPRAVR